MERFTVVVVFSIEAAKTFVKTFFKPGNTFFHLHKSHYFDLIKLTKSFRERLMERKRTRL